MQTNQLECLAPELQSMIYDLLDYQTSIRLSQVSRYLNAMVDPQDCTADKNSNFVARAQYWASYNLYR